MRKNRSVLQTIMLLVCVFYVIFEGLATIRNIFIERPFNLWETIVSITLTILFAVAGRRHYYGRYWSTKANSRNSATGGSTTNTGSGARDGTGEGTDTREGTSPRIGRLFHNRLLISKSHITRLPVSRGSMPILAKRGARLVYDFALGKPKLLPVFVHFWGDPLEIDKDAKCYVPGRRHSAPALNCRCGFYAVTSDADCIIPECGVTLLVELSGIVIEYHRGYRAQHQRILECHIPRCMCGRPAELVVMCKGVSDFHLTYEDLYTMCIWHNKVGLAYRYADTKVMTLDELSEHLGIKVLAV